MCWKQKNISNEIPYENDNSKLYMRDASSPSNIHHCTKIAEWEKLMYLCDYFLCDYL